MEDITDCADYSHAKRVCKNFEIKNLREYLSISLYPNIFEYSQWYIIVSCYIWELSRYVSCLKIYGLDHAHFLTAQGLVWQAALKKTKVKLNLLTHIDMLLMIEKGIRGRICHSICWYTKANKYMKDYDKNKESSYLQYLDVNNLHCWALLQKLSVHNLEWIKDTSQFNKNFIKNYKVILLKLMSNILEN